MAIFFNGMNTWHTNLNQHAGSLLDITIAVKNPWNVTSFLRYGGSEGLSARLFTPAVGSWE
jgi:hypothetical protein